MWLNEKAAPTGAASAEPRNGAAGAGITIMRSPGDPACDDMVLALQARDWTTARGYLIRAPNSEIFADRLVGAADVGGVEAWIDNAIRDEPGSTLPLLVKGARYTYWAWEARGGGRADTVPENVWPIWFDRLRRAEEALAEVVDREPGNAEAWHWLIVLARARQVSAEERWRRYHGLVAADPTNYYGHTQMLDGLMRKWSGSDEAMFDFARKTAAAHPGTNLPVLVAMAHLEHRYEYEDRWAYMYRDDVGGEVRAAAYASILHPDYRASHFTAHAGNWFALALAHCGYLSDAESFFDMLGDAYVTKRPWGDGGDAAQSYANWRDVVRRTLAENRAQRQTS
jgi:hypothetical protein